MTITGGSSCNDKIEKFACKTLRNMNLMWSEMTDAAREEYKAFFLAYHDTVSCE